MTRDALLSLCTADLPPTTPDTLWRSWSLAPEAVAPLALLLILALAGWLRPPARGNGPSGAERLAFLAGWALLALALVSPLCRLAATLISGHMVQLIVLTVIAPVLLALGRPWTTLTAAWRGSNAGGEAPPDARARIGLGTLTALYGALLWVWHALPVYTLILTSQTAHVAFFAAVIVVSVLFWSAAIRTREGREGRAVVALFSTMAHTGLLGAILTFAGTPLYPIQAPGALAWGLDPLHDQQLAGLLMWVVGGALYLAAALALLGAWLDRPLDASHSAPPRADSA